MSRIRSNAISEPWPEPYINSRYKLAGDPTWYTGVGTGPSGYPNKVDTTTVDVVTPNFRKRIAAGEIINNPFNRTIRTYLSPGLVDVVREIGWYPNPNDTSELGLTQYGTYGKIYPDCANAFAPGPVNFLVPVADVSACIAEAVTRAHANIDTSEMLALATAAESRKTLDSMGEIFLRVIRIARNVRKLNIKALRNELSPKELSRRYLELRYAIRPLIYDAAGLCAALEKERTHARKTFRGWASRKASLTDVVTGAPVLYGTTVCDLNRSATHEVSSRAGVLTDVEISDLTVFGIDQLAETAWELVPFSFIIDWFVQVGNTIAAWTPNAGVTQRASWVTTKSIRSSLNSLVPGSARFPGTYAINNVSVDTFVYGEVVDELYREPDPQLSVFPIVSLHLDTFKLIDLGLILKQILR